MAHYGKVSVGELLSDRTLRLEVAKMLGKPESDLLSSISGEDDTLRLEDIFEDPIPDELEHMKVSWVRDEAEMISKIAKHTGLTVAEVDDELSSAHGGTLLSNLFTFIWIERPAATAGRGDKVKTEKRAGRGANGDAKMHTVRQASDARGRGSRAENKVFLVHGHDEAAKETVARFLEKLRLTVVILHEQPSRGRTIIEKFEEHSDVPFAVVLLTPDDVGHSSKGDNNTHHRARQNVVFELGYFIGKLGRNRVCALHKSSLELPSDYSGILYVAMESSWKFELAKELKQVFPCVDMNGIL
jgi:predicted nucleotide-binding protein